MLSGLHRRDQRALAVEIITNALHGDRDRTIGVVADDLIGHPDRLRLDRIEGASSDDQTGRIDQAVDAAAGEQLARQALGAAVARQQVEIDLGLTEAGLEIGDDIGAGQDELAAAAQGRAVDRCDHRLAEILQCGKGRVRRVRRCLGRFEIAGLAHLEQLLDVGAGDEGRACTGHDQGDRVLALADVLQHRVQFIEGAFIEGIDGR